MQELSPGRYVVEDSESKSCVLIEVIKFNGQLKYKYSMTPYLCSLDYFDNERYTIHRVEE